MLKKIFLLFFCGLLFSCGIEKHSQESSYIDEVLYKFAKSRKKYGLTPAGQGGGLDLNGKVASFFITFNTNRFITLEETRVLLVENIEALLEMINSEKDHLEYYESLPFPVNRIEISIYGKESPNSKNIYISHSLKGMLYYYTPNPKGTNFGSVKIHQETFEEAKRIVSIQRVQKLSSIN